MKTKLLSKDGNKIKLVIEEVGPSFINALRRAIMFQVPVLAIEDVYYTKNDSALYDEQLAIRLGLIPLKTDLKTYNLPGECSCKGKGCSKCQENFTLKAKGPCTVYAKDLNSDLILYPDMPIVILLKDQEIDLTAVAVMGTGEDHAKWVNGLAFYQHYPKIKIESGSKAKEGIKSCPRDVFEGEKVKNIENCNLCKACEEKSDGAIQVSEVEDKFIFTLESWGQISPVDLLKEAAKLVSDKVEELKLK